MLHNGSVQPGNAARLVNASALPQSVLDRATANVLRQKFALGLFEDVGTPDASVIDSPEARALAREAATQGTVLLQNSGILPLGSIRSRKIAVLGLLGGCPNHTEHPPYAWCAAKQAQLDDYSTGWGGYGTTLRGYESLQVVTVEAALRRRGAQVSWVAGASPDCQPNPPPASCTGSFCPVCAVANEKDIQAAVDAAQKADVIVMVVGDSASGHHLSGTAGEGNDRQRLEAPGAQAALLAAVTDQPALLKKLVLVHIGGRPMTFPNNGESAKAIPAILTAMRPGEEGGEAVASILTGETSPSGRLTNTWVRDVGQVGTAVQPYWQFKQIATKDWMDGPATALYPFGHGLSFATFSFSDLAVKSPSRDATKDDTAVLSVTVRNTGEVASAVTVQAYCSSHNTPRVRVMRYAQLLCAFTKVFLQPNASTTARLPVALRTLARWDPDRASRDLQGASVRGSYVVDAGSYGVAVGDCSAAGSALGLQDAVPCEQQRANMTIAKTVVFSGKGQERPLKLDDESVGHTNLTNSTRRVRECDPLVKL